MKIHVNNTDDFVPWQKAKTLTYTVFKVFDDKKNVFLKKQIFKSSIGIMNALTIAVMYHDNCKHNDIYITKAIESCAEVSSLLHMSKYVNNIEEGTANHLIQLTEGITKAIKDHAKL